VAHKTIRNVSRYWDKKRPSKKSRKHPAQSLMDREKFLIMKERE